MQKLFNRGWWWPPNCRRAHYFLDGYKSSRCGQWVCEAERTEEVLDGTPLCPTCAELKDVEPKRLRKRTRQKAYARRNREVSLAWMSV